MWQKLIELLLKKYLDGVTPRRKAAKALVGLYVSMVNCHDAYRAFAASRDELPANEWYIAIGSLSEYLYDLRFALQIHDPKLYAVIVEYTLQEGQSMENYWREVAQRNDQAETEMPDTWRLERRRKYMTDRIGRFTRYSMDPVERRRDFKGVGDDARTNDFPDAIAKLASFIKSRYSFEDVLDA